jgi:REP element-mobilizing transposase RayT
VTDLTYQNGGRRACPELVEGAVGASLGNGVPPFRGNENGGRCAVGASLGDGGNGVPPSRDNEKGGRCAVNAALGDGGNGVPPFRGNENGGRGAVNTADSGSPIDRKRPAHMPLRDSGNLAQIVFLTVCAQDRKIIFAKPEVHTLIVSSWQRAKRWSVGCYVIMPDHIHLFCSPATFPAEPIRTWVKYWKTLVSKVWPYPEDQPIWQQDCWDTQLRRGDRYSEKWEYVRNNPIRAKLSTTPEQWPYQGQLNILMWHDE